MTNTKETNPKDAVGCTKAPLSVVPAQVIFEIGLGMLEGSCKYGAHNYRVAGVRASIYYDAAMRHMMDWWEGQDIDPVSGLNHVTKALTTLTVLRDAMLQDMMFDDRPPRALRAHWMDEANARAAAIIAKYPEPVMPYTELNQRVPTQPLAPPTIEPPVWREVGALEAAEPEAPPEVVPVPQGSTLSYRIKNK